MKGIAGKVLLLIASSILFSLILDRALGLAGFPAEAPPASILPPGKSSRVENIEFVHTVRANSLGLRDGEVSPGKAPGVRRIWVAGDSFVLGAGVEREERFVDLLEARLRSTGRAVEWINGGLPGTSPAKYGRLLLNTGLELGLDGVLLCVYANDLTETPDVEVHRFLYRSRWQRPPVLKLLHALWPRIYTILDRFKERLATNRRTRPSDLVQAVSREALARGIPAERVEEWKRALPPELVEEANRGRFNGAMLSHGLLNPAYWSDPMDGGTRRAEARWRTMSRILSEILKACRERSVEVAVVFLPTVFQHDPSSHVPGNPWVLAGARTSEAWLSSRSFLQQRLEAWAAERGVPYLDLTPFFRQAEGGEPLNYRLDFHWTPAGHEVAASAIGSWIEERSVFSFITRSGARSP